MKFKILLLLMVGIISVRNVRAFDISSDITASDVAQEHLELRREFDAERKKSEINTAFGQGLFLGTYFGIALVVLAESVYIALRDDIKCYVKYSQ